MLLVVCLLIGRMVGGPALAAGLARENLVNAPGRLGTQLEAGMLLVYASDGVLQPPWTVDSLRRGIPLFPGAECAVIHLRRRPRQTEPEENRLCLSHDTLYRWEAQGERWTIARPVGPDMVWSANQANGATVRYETGPVREESISGRTIPVVLTTITTTDSSGGPKQRLRERYALALTSATGGIFEAPDSSGRGRWLTNGRFELREIRLP